MFDVTILTDRRYINSRNEDQYTKNVLHEDKLLEDSLISLGYKVTRTNWDDSSFDWSKTKTAIFRSTWDYFDRYSEFDKWLKTTSKLTHFINPIELIEWNIDKHYLIDLEKKGVRIPASYFIEKGDERTLAQVISELKWDEFILKPVVSGGGRHTYRFKKEKYNELETIFEELLKNESLMLQEFQQQITTKGEVAFMVFGGKFSHAVLKKAKEGDFRVQDDFGGSIYPYKASKEEISFVEKAFNAVSPAPIYARIDVLWNNENDLCLGEIELIEPELWFRMHTESALNCAKAIALELDSI